VETKECKTESDFIIHHLLIKEKTRSRQRKQEIDPCENLSFARGLSYGSGKSPQWPVQYYADVQGGGSWIEVRFAAGRMDSRFHQYLISFHLKAHKPGLLSEQVISVSLNGYPVGCMWFDHDPQEKEAILLVSQKLLKENDINIIRLKTDEPLPTIEPSPPDPRLQHDRETGWIELLDLVLRPSLPPVAHAGGGYRGLTYTNSVEALRENADTFTFFEIDLEWTRDEQLVCLHDWGETFTRLFGFEIEEPLPLDTFQELRTVSGITPLTVPLLQDFLLDNPSARIITDVKSNNIRALRKLVEQIPDGISRIIPQIYQPEEFVKAVEIGYKDIIWALYRYPYKYNPMEIMSKIQKWEDENNRKPFGIVMPVPVVEKGVAKIMEEAKIPVYAHTINTCTDYRHLLQLGVSSVYTDLLDIDTCYDRSTPHLNSSCPICLLP
jgi:glycerophosphoryl diester phosphodiesterase